MSNNQIITSVATCTLVEEGIIVYEIHPNSDFTIEGLKEGRAANAELSGGHDYCILVTGGDFSTFGKDAREAQATEEYTKNRFAMALVTSNSALELMAKLFLKINRPKGDTKIFSDDAKALAWLRMKRDEHYKK